MNFTLLQHLSNFPLQNYIIDVIFHFQVIEYEDGTPATLSQLAKDVCTFLVWSASPEHDERKQIGIKAQIVCATMFGLVLYVKRHKWSVLKTQKIVFNPKK